MRFASEMATVKKSEEVVRQEIGHGLGARFRDAVGDRLRWPRTDRSFTIGDSLSPAKNVKLPFAADTIHFFDIGEHIHRGYR